MKEKISELANIYRAYEEDTRDMVAVKACERGCSFCCEAAGTIDITTLEGMALREAMNKMPKSRQKLLTQAFRSEIRKREAGKATPCPFLMKNKACMIYEERPFACRRIYSLHICTKENPPSVSRQVMERADRTIKELQKIDDTGYSGNLSYIIYMLSVPAFMTTYMAGDFKPEEIMEFGKTHKIMINRMAP